MTLIATKGISMKPQTQTQTQTKAPTTSELLAMIDALSKQNAALQASMPKPRELTMKVSEKGCLAVYGLGRFPVTLYWSQWQRLLASADKVSAFGKANESLFKTKEGAQ
jgi:hypothetical protein